MSRKPTREALYQFHGRPPLGSAVSRAQAYGVDTRIMFSAGTAAAHLGLLGEGVQQVLAIPVSISSKSPFFDRG